MTEALTYDFTGKVALVTGASTGIGLVSARAFAEAGAAVALIARSANRLDQAVAYLNSRGFKALGIPCDVSDEQQVADAVNRTVAEFGRLDMAFNNAGIMKPVIGAADEPGEDFDRIVAINLRGIWASTKHELRQMREQGAGTIVNCSSLAGIVGGPGRAAYHATKHGIIGYTKSVALEYAARGIRANVICPGTIETPMVDHMTETNDLNTEATLAVTPMKRYGKPEEIAAAALWLCSEASSYVTGVALPVDGGYVA